MEKYFLKGKKRAYLNQLSKAMLTIRLESQYPKPPMAQHLFVLT